MKNPMQKPIIDAEAFMKFFEETTGAKFVGVDWGNNGFSADNAEDPAAFVKYIDAH